MSKLRPFLPKSIILLIIQQNLACPLFRRCWFQIWHLLSKILSQNAKFWAFWTKINFLILPKFFPCTLFRTCWFQVWHSLCVVLSILVPRLHQLIQFSLFCNLFGKFFLFLLPKSQNIMVPIAIILKVLIANMTLKKCKHILSLAILRL